MDGGAWKAAVHGVTKIWKQPKGSYISPQWNLAAAAAAAAKSLQLRLTLCDPMLSIHLILYHPLLLLPLSRMSYTLEEAMATHSSILAWRIQGQRSLVACCLWGRTETDTSEAT